MLQIVREAESHSFVVPLNAGRHSRKSGAAHIITSWTVVRFKTIASYINGIAKL